MKPIYTKVEEPAPVEVYVPYTKVTPLLQTVVDSLRIQSVQPALVKVDEFDGYWRLLRDAWNERREFFVVEQDVLVWPGAIEMLARCGEEWCTLPTMCHGRTITTTFGCVKFGARMIERNPDIWDRIEPTWCYLDAHLSEDMGWPFITPHAHYPMAAHINEVQWPESISRRFTDKKVGWYSMEAGGSPVVYAGNKADEAFAYLRGES
jgi:hypothetical protein